MKAQDLVSLCDDLLKIQAEIHKALVRRETIIHRLEGYMSQDQVIVLDGKVYRWTTDYDFDIGYPSGFVEQATKFVVNREPKPSEDKDYRGGL